MEVPLSTEQLVFGWGGCCWNGPGGYCDSSGLGCGWMCEGYEGKRAAGTCNNLDYQEDTSGTQCYAYDLPCDESYMTVGGEADPNICLLPNLKSLQIGSSGGSVNEDYYSGTLPYPTMSSLPSCFSNMTNLTYLRLNSNTFTSTPSEVCNMTSLKAFDISSNNIAGDYPTCLNELPSLEKVDYSNQTGMYTWQSGGGMNASTMTNFCANNPTHYKEIDLGRSAEEKFSQSPIDGSTLTTLMDISCLFGLTGLERLYLSSNHLISGCVGEGICNNPSMEHVTLNGNYLCQGTDEGNDSECCGREGCGDFPSCFQCNGDSWVDNPDYTSGCSEGQWSPYCQQDIHDDCNWAGNLGCPCVSGDEDALICENATSMGGENNYSQNQIPDDRTIIPQTEEEINPQLKDTLEYQTQKGGRTKPLK